MQGQDHEMGCLSQQFTSIEQSAWDTLGAVKEAPEPRIKLEEVKGFLKELESTLDAIEKTAAELSEETQALQGSLRGFRKRYNDIVNAIMKEDSLYPYGTEYPSIALRRTSDLIFGETPGGGGILQGQVTIRERDVFSDEEGKYSEDLDDSPSDLQELERGKALQRLLYISGAVLLFIFLGLFIYLRCFY